MASSLTHAAPTFAAGATRRADPADDFGVDSTDLKALGAGRRPVLPET